MNKLIMVLLLVIVIISGFNAVNTIYGIENNHGLYEYLDAFTIAILCDFVIISALLIIVFVLVSLLNKIASRFTVVAVEENE